MTKEEFFCYDCFQGEFFMKRICIALLFLLLISVCSLMSSPIYKSFTINGETVSRWVVEKSVTEYDTIGKKIYHKNLISEIWNEYDSDGNLIHIKDSSGREDWYEYDANGNEIHSKDSYGNERWHEYDAGGNLIHKKVSSGSEWWYEYEYHQNKQIKKVTEYKRF